MRGAIGLAIVAVVCAAALSVSPPPAAAWSTSCCLPWDAPHQIVLSPDGRFAYSAAYNITLLLARDPDTGSLKVLDSYDAGGGAMELSPDGSNLYVAATDGPYVSAFARDAQSGALTRTGTWAGASQTVYSDLQMSHDGRQLYLSDTGRDAIVTLDRAPATGALSYRGEIRSGDPGVEDLQAPGGLALSADDRFLYAGSTVSFYGLLTFARAPDGGLTFAAGNPTCNCGSGDVTLGPDGRHLFGGPIDVSAVDRDPDSGQVGEDATFAGVSYSGSPPVVADDQVAVSPDGSAVWFADEFNDKLIQLSYGPSGFAVVKTFREGLDGQGLRKPRGVVISPDGLNVYVPSAEQAFDRGGRIAVFRRDPDTNRLTFVSLFEGPFFTGKPPDEENVPEVKINGGDEYTNDPDVELTVSHLDDFAAGFGFDVSNDGGFGDGTEHLDFDGTDDRYPWTLATSGPERLPKTVYVRVFGPVGKGGVITDEIVLDQRPPAVDAAVLLPRTAARGAKATRAARLRIRAHDRLSGVSRMQVTHNRRRPGRWRLFRRTATVPRGHGAVWVRVRDRATNHSRWRRAGRRR
jgi:6-phosphogluconolactonase (cycloisomerase 2 family)